MHSVAAMKTCEGCGNKYDKAFEVTTRGGNHVFDCFECAINTLAPKCARCGVTVIGHGIEVGSSFYCCAHCARESGTNEARDRV